MGKGEDECAEALNDDSVVHFDAAHVDFLIRVVTSRNRRFKFDKLLVNTLG